MNNFENEMEPLGRGGDEVTRSCEEQTTAGTFDYLKLKSQFQKTCLVFKRCVRYVCFGVVVCAFLVILHKISKLENKIEVDKTEHLTSVPHQRHEKLKSQLKHIYLPTSEAENHDTVINKMTKKSPGPRIIKKGNANSEEKADTSDAISERDMNEGKYYLNIGMREDTLMQDCNRSHMKHSFPDIDYAFLGYDLFRGYPLAHGHDPGFTFPIFHADYTNGQQTADCRYSVPKGLVVVPDVSCVTSFTSDIIQTRKQLTHELSANAEAGGGGFGFAFFASVGYKQASSDLSAHDSVYIISSARCNYYFSKFKKESPPPFTDIFLSWVEKLNTTLSIETYLDFFHTFGTHFPKEVIFGARYIYEHKMKSSVYKKKRESGVNIKAQASYSGLVRVSGGFSLSEQQRVEAFEFSKSVETNTITVGAAPPSNGDAMTWAASVQSNPVPSKYKLEPIEDLFREEYMGELGVDYEAISENLRKLKNQYYEKLLSENQYNQITDMSNGRLTKILTVENGGQYGSWFQPQFCPEGTFAIGFNMKYDDNQKSDADKTGLNAINLLCANRKGVRVKDQELVQSQSGYRGHWTGDVVCLRGKGVPRFLQSFELMVHEPKGTEDDTEANAVRFTCRDSQSTQKPNKIEKHITSAQGYYGKSSEKCPNGSAICGIQTRVEGHIPHKDNTCLNDVRFFCCTFE